MMELATNTIKADSTIGSQRVVRKAMCNLLRVWAQLRDFHVRLTRLLDAVKRVHFARRGGRYYVEYVEHEARGIHQGSRGGAGLSTGRVSPPHPQRCRSVGGPASRPDIITARP